MEFQYTELGNDVFAYQVREGNEKVGEITWTLLGDIMVMDHTFVSPKLRGGGVAKQLLDQASDYARKKEYKMEAVCSYVVTAFDRYKDYEDVKA